MLTSGAGAARMLVAMGAGCDVRREKTAKGTSVGRKDRRTSFPATSFPAC